MKIYEFKDERNKKIITELVDIWESSVRATHLFLSQKEIDKIKEYVPKAIENVEHLIIAYSDQDYPIAFMGIEKQKIEMLFVKNVERGKGVGTKLIKFGIVNFAICEVTVNEDNIDAIKFYKSIGFEIYKRSDIDEQENNYPILYMRLNINKKIVNCIYNFNLLYSCQRRYLE